MVSWVGQDLNRDSNSMTIAPGARTIRLDRPIDLEFGETLKEATVAYETWGELSPNRDNVILLIPAFSAGSHASSTAADPSPGWWQSLIGLEKPLDTRQFFVICPSILGSCYGTTGPASPSPDSKEDAAWGADFPTISIRDMVTIHGLLLDALNIDHVHAVVGGSLGGMQSIQFGVQFPSRAHRIVSISATDQTRPYTAAIRHIGRQSIINDPAWKKGRYGDTPPLDGLRRAREVGTLFYRSREEFNERFDWDPVEEPSVDRMVFDVQRYLLHQGQKVVRHFDANCYLTLSMAMDLHHIGRGFPSIEAAVNGITASVLVAGVIEDRLIPCDEQRDLAKLLLACGIDTQWTELSSPVGHDTFLVDMDMMAELIGPFLSQG